MTTVFETAASRADGRKDRRRTKRRRALERMVTYSPRPASRRAARGIYLQRAQAA
jgi:hypothetical protein